MSSLSRNKGISPLALVFWGLLISFIIAAPAYILEGWVITKLWAWFVVTQFGIAQIGIAEAVGLSTLLTLVTHPMPTVKNKDGSYEFSASFYWLFLRPLTILLVGYIAFQVAY